MVEKKQGKQYFARRTPLDRELFFLVVVVVLEYLFRDIGASKFITTGRRPRRRSRVRLCKWFFFESTTTQTFSELLLVFVEKRLSRDSAILAVVKTFNSRVASPFENTADATARNV